MLFTHLLCICRVVGIVLCMYANFPCYNYKYGPVIGICLRLFVVVASVDISQLWVYLCYLLIYCLGLFVVVYKLVMFRERG